MSKKIIIGWTYQHPVSYPYGKICVTLCTAQQHNYCTTKGECEAMRPTCLAAQCGMVGKKMIEASRRRVYAKITENDLKLIASKLHRAWLKCHCVVIIVQ